MEKFPFTIVSHKMIGDLVQKRMQRQTDEFDALDKLIQRYKNLPAIVDDDYPEQRHYYEAAVRNFLAACKANER